MLCARALVRALNDANNYAQQGCAMQFDGITLTTSVGRLASTARSLRRPPLTFFQSRRRSFNDLLKRLQTNSKIVKNIVKGFVLVNYTL